MAMEKPTENLLDRAAGSRVVTGADGAKYNVFVPAAGSSFFGFSSVQNKDNRTGWKIHVSAGGQEALEPLIQLGMRYKIPSFKCVDSTLFDKFLDPQNEQSGKMLTFYHDDYGADGKMIDWHSFMQEAEKLVLEHGGAGPFVKHDAKIRGSSAIYYRNERGAAGEHYLPRDGLTLYAKAAGISEGQLYNPSGATDPFADIDTAKHIAKSVALILKFRCL